jgi:uncharacterized protein YukE
MADKQRLQQSEINRLQTEIVDRYDATRDQLRKLQGILDTMEANWRGIGAKAFNTKQVEINERVQHIGQLLSWFLENIERTSKDKLNLDDQVRADMQSIDVQHGGARSALNSY